MPDRDLTGLKPTAPVAGLALFVLALLATAALFVFAGGVWWAEGDPGADCYAQVVRGGDTTRLEPGDSTLIVQPVRVDTVYLAPVPKEDPGPGYVPEASYRNVLTKAQAWRGQVECARSHYPTSSFTRAYHECLDLDGQ